MDRAALIHEYHKRFSDGARVDIIIWRLSYISTERPHGLKYRLNYCLADGSILVRYDNKKGKADHKHIEGVQLLYEFSSIRQLLLDFKTDVRKQGGRIW